ncbi:MAG: hypothetical protein RI967_2094 [Planctomycetota bacterium]
MSRRVLVIDDERAIARAVAARLEAAGHAVACAFTAHEGLRLAREGAFHAMVLDLRLPDLDGIALLALLRDDERTRATPAVLVSASLSPESRDAAQRLGASASIAKPFNWRELVAVIEAAMEARAREAANPKRPSAEEAPHD